MITIFTRCNERRKMVRMLSEQLNVPAIYLGTPTYAYRIGELTVSHDASVCGEPGQLIPAAECLLENGYIDEMPAELAASAEPAENSVAETENSPTDAGMVESSPTEASEADSKTDDSIPTRVHIHEPAWDVPGMKNLVRILFTRQYLINRMVKMDRLYIDPEVIDLMHDGDYPTVSDLEAMLHEEEQIGMIRSLDITDGTVSIEMPADDGTTCQWMYYSQLMTAVIKQAKASKRTKAEKQEPANDKYMANAWLTRLGFGGADYKDLRHAFMAHLNGYAAFRNDERMQAHKNRLAEQRRIRREAHSDD